MCIDAMWTCPDQPSHHENMNMMEDGGWLLPHPVTTRLDTPSSLRTDPFSVKMPASPPRISLFTLTFNPAPVGVAPVHHYKDNAPRPRIIDAHLGSEPRTWIILHRSATLDAVS